MKKIIKALSAVAAVVIVAGGLVVASGAPSAEAHTPRVEATCQGWSVNLSSYGQGYQVSIYVDDNSAPAIQNARIDNHYSNSGTWPTDRENHTLRAQITRLDGRGDQYTRSIPAHANGCEAPAVVTPQIQDYLANCDARFVLDNTGSNRPVVYTINGTAYNVAAGTAPHVGPIPMNASFGYEITTDSGRAWSFAHTSEQLDACAGPKPSDRVQYIYSQWSDDGICTTPGQATVQQSQSVTVRTTTYVREGLVWVPVTTDEFLTTKVRERDLTHEERVACAGPQPPADEASSTSEWMGGVFECGDQTVTEERTVTTTRVEYLLNDDYVWVAGEEQTTVTTESQTRPLTDDERADQAEACTIIPPTDPPVVDP